MNYAIFKKAFFLLLLTFFALPSPGQTKLSTTSKKAIELYREADNYRVRRQYNQAKELLESAIKKDKGFIEAYIRLATIYKALKDYDQARVLLNQAEGLKPAEKTILSLEFELGELHMKFGEYDSALVHLNNYLGASPRNPTRVRIAKSMVDNASYALENQQIVAEFNPIPLGEAVNQFALQYFPVLTVDQNTLIYTRRFGTAGIYDEDLVLSEKGPNGEWSNPKSISDNINSEYNEGTCTISADGRILIFTSCLGRKGYGSCDLFICYKTGSEWSRPSNLGPIVNSSSWDSQPSLSADGRTLYFASTRRGGKGGSDLWATKLDDNDEWTAPVNMGDKINTPFDDISPFIHANGQTFYFATKGRKGFGGFDIFYCEQEGEEWGSAQNLGNPINTNSDQTALFITADGTKGYYSLEEITDTQPTRSVLYQFDVPKSAQVRHRANFVKGSVKDIKTAKPLAAKVELFDLKNQKRISLVNSDAVSGEYTIVLAEGSEYALYVSREGYLFKSLTFDYTDGDFEPVRIDVLLEPIEEGVKTVLENIFFDLNSYKLKDKSKTELNKIVRFLKDNPNIKVEIAGHTDNSGGEKYNFDLSVKRAKAVFDYLIGSEVPANILSYKGYGERQPVRPNDTEANRQMNRRIEFKIKEAPRN
ncbi:MAG: OmpA family protein [Bacteroidota bacterium]